MENNEFVRSETEADFKQKMLIRKMVHAVETKSQFIMSSGRRYGFSKMVKDTASIIKRRLDHPLLTITDITWVDQMVDAIYNKHTNCRTTHYYSMEEWKLLTETF